MSAADTGTPRRPKVARVLAAALALQVVIGALLVLADPEPGRLALPGLGPDAPRLSEPVSPGDQRRRFRPDRDLPATRPARDPGALPPRLALTPIEGATWRLEGAIAAGDAGRIIERLAEVSPRPEWLVLQSPGGAVLEALALGRHLRREGVGTRILAGEYCHSACPWLFAGGAAREAGSDAILGVHQHYFGKNVMLPAAFAVEDIQTGQGMLMAYLDEMGIDPLVMRHALVTPPDEIYVLVPAELRAYGFITAGG